MGLTYHQPEQENKKNKHECKNVDGVKITTFSSFKCKKECEECGNLKNQVVHKGQMARE